MRLVPKQLRRSGMTGTVPYYGGRLSPRQAYAAAHGSPPVPPAAPPAAPPPLAPSPDPARVRAALDELRAAGVLTDQEAARLAQKAAP